MADLIDRDAIIAEYDRVHVGAPGGARKLMQDAPAVNRWISVEDALPDALKNVLVCTDINTVTIAWINGDGWTFADTGGGHTENWSFGDVKYWMNLPEPPKGEQK